MPDNLQPLAEVPKQHDAPQPAAPIAPAWHTLAVLALFAILTYAHHGHSSLETSTSHIPTYLASIANGWALLAIVVAGLYHRREFFLTTLKQNARPWYVELLRAVTLFLTYLIASGGIAFALRHTHFANTIDRTTVEAVAPTNFAELAFWLLVSLTAGFCEEHIFRGYLLHQFIEKLRAYKLSPRIASVISVLATGVIFGSMHMYEGIGGAILVGVLGIIFAAYALYFRNLRAVILAHILQDFIIGTLIFIRHTNHA